MKENVIVKKTIAFSINIIAFSEELEAKRKYIIARQLLKSGTSIGANIHEAKTAKVKLTSFIKLKLRRKRSKKQNIG